MKVKVGDLVNTTEYLKVEEVNQDGLVVKNLHNDVKFRIKGKELIDELRSADSFDKTEKVTKTELAERMMKCYNVVFTVSFDKANGIERVLRGRLMSHEPLMGRSYCEDLDIDGTPDKRLRQVDHRTLNYLIVNNVKYVLKGAK